MWILILVLFIIFLLVMILFNNIELKIKIFKRIIDYCKKSIEKNCQRSKKEKIQIDGETYSILTPIITEDSLYLKLLEEAVETLGIKNIGLTGSYGSGKSSIIKSFIRKNPSYNTISISLLHFLECYEEKKKNEEDNFKDNENEVSKKEYRELLEKNIFQQIFFSVHAKKIPLSRFRRIKKPTLLSKFFVVVIITLLLLNIFLVKENSFFLEKYGEFYYRITVFLISIVNFSIIFFKLKKLKFKFLENDIELSSLCNNEDEKNILNEYLDEIIYYINIRGIDVIIIEDLDRFESQKIFLNLREINLMINNSEEIEKKVTFIYAVKDELFNNNERTKFFDFIIPVIPIISSVNSEGYLKRNLDENLFSSKKFLENIFLYVYDMRLGLNIINEFKIYRKILERKEKFSEKENEKILALIAYKNLFPKEFAALVRNEGELYEIFNNRKKNILKKFITRIDKEIVEKKEILERRKKEFLSSIEELKLLYSLMIIKYFNAIIRVFELENSQIEVKSKKDLVLIFDYVLEHKKIRYKPANSYDSIESKIDLEAIENHFEIDKENNFQNRLKYLTINLEKEESFLNREIFKLEQKKIMFENKSLSNLLMEDLNEEEKKELILGTTNNLGLKEEKTYDFKRYLLINGFIDERYYFYISYFYEGALSDNDRHFISYVLGKREKGENLPIDNHKNVLEHLKTEKSIYILNYELLKYVTNIKKGESKEDKENKKNNYKKMIEIIGANWQQTFSVVEGYIQKENLDKEKFFSELVKANSKIWLEILEHKNKIETYIELFINNLSIEEIKNIDKECEGKFINSIRNFSNILEYEIKNERLEVIINEFGIKIKEIKYIKLIKENNGKILKTIIESEAYEINLINIKVIYKYLSEDDIREEKILKQLKNLEKIWKYILDNKNKFLKEIYFRINHSQEDEEGLIEIINTMAVKDELLEKLLVNMSPIITDLKELNEDLWDIFFEKMKIKNNFKNLKDYVEIRNQGKYLEGKILDYLELNISNFQEDIITEDEKIFEELMEDKIETELFKKILDKFKVKKVTILENKIEEIYKNKIKYLINDGIIEFNEKTFGIIYELLLETKEFNKFMDKKTEGNSLEKDIQIKYDIVMNKLDKDYSKVLKMLISRQGKGISLNKIFKNIVEKEEISTIDSHKTFSDTYKEVKDIFESNLEIYGENFKEKYLKDVKRWENMLFEDGLLEYNKEFLLDLLEDKDEFSIELQEKLNIKFVAIDWKEEIEKQSKILELFLLLYKNNFIEQGLEKEFIKLLMSGNIGLETFKLVIENNKFLIQKIKSDSRRNILYRKKVNFLNELNS